MPGCGVCTRRDKSREGGQRFSSKNRPVMPFASAWAYQSVVWALHATMHMVCHCGGLAHKWGLEVHCLKFALFAALTVCLFFNPFHSIQLGLTPPLPARRLPDLLCLTRSSPARLPHVCALLPCPCLTRLAPAVPRRPLPPPPGALYVIPMGPCPPDAGAPSAPSDWAGGPGPGAGGPLSPACTCAVLRGRPPPLDHVMTAPWAQGCVPAAVRRRRRDPPPPLPMFGADSQTFASAPSVPRGFTLNNFRAPPPPQSGP